MVPLSTSRIYLFDIKYSDNDEDLLKQIVYLIKNKFSGFKFKNVEIKVVKNKDELKKEMHINHLFYQNRRTFDIEMSNIIRLKIVNLLKFIKSFSYKEIHLINDGFDRKPSLGLSRRNT